MRLGRSAPHVQHASAASSCAGSSHSLLASKTFIADASDRASAFSPALPRANYRGPASKKVRFAPQYRLFRRTADSMKAEAVIEEAVKYKRRAAVSLPS